MIFEKTIADSKENKYSIITKEESSFILSNSKILIEKDTLISDKIRLLKFQNVFFIQEKSNKDELLIRIVKTEKEGEDFINKRMETYDKMWDGCGCKVEYYS